MINIAQIKTKIANATIVDKFIYLNLAIFLFAFISNTFIFLSNSHTNFIIEYFALSKDANQYLFKPYTFISYGFIHISFIHILFNLIFLYYLGHLFLQFFSAKLFSYYYILGTIFGGIFFVLSYQYFPVFKNQQGVLLGASAGISALLVGLATQVPNYEINLRLIGYVKLWILALAYIVLSLILIPNGNAGGQIAHLGGAFIGFILTTYFFNPNKKIKIQHQHLKTVYNAKDKSDDFGLSVHQKKIILQRKVDLLLDKISKSGYESLTEDERDFLDQASKKITSDK